jgi:choloylglycine hydrolase
MDGLNEAGLAVGTFYFPTFAEYTPVTSGNQAKALSPIDFPNWILTRFASVEEVRKAVERGDVIVAPTVLKGWGPEVQPFHYGIWDKTGAGIVIEPIGGKLVIHDNPIGTITNSPNFDWHMTNLRNYIALAPRNVPPLKIDGTTLAPLGQGSGMLGLPGDFTPPSRFVRASVFSITAIPSDTAEEGVTQAFHILNNFDIPVGIAREKSDGVLHTDYTLMTMVRDLRNLRYYYKSYDDQTIRMIDLKKLDFGAKGIKKMTPKTSQPIVDATKTLK